MNRQYSSDKTQPKEMCATCRHAGRIVDYSGKGKSRRMWLYCEWHKISKEETYLCYRYESEGGKSPFRNGSTGTYPDTNSKRV